ncbi:MAG: hypothetical protein HY701_01540 [Gemmatimonadetes bacterium]|nr:hypothetical protein [Gemmatimonadota bacterium]
MQTALTISGRAAPLLGVLIGAFAFPALAAQRPGASYPADATYQIADEAWGELPTGRVWGATSAVHVAPDRMHVWVADRCGQTTCVGRSDVDPVLLFDPEGRLVRSFGKGLFAWPHGLHVDREGNVWVADATSAGQAEPAGLGHVVYKFSPEGRLLMTLGQKGGAGRGPNTFRKPTGVVVAPNGDIFIADGHGDDGNNRIVKLASDGRFLKEWGSTGSGAGEFREPHALAMDSRGRLFVGDRGNHRIQIFDQEGTHLATWTQFGSPSGLYIDGNDVLYAADSDSNARRNPGWRRGIYIGSARDGWVTAFIPDPEPNPDALVTSGAEGVTADGLGNVYGAEVGPRTVKKYQKVGGS